MANPEKKPMRKRIRRKPKSKAKTGFLSSPVFVNIVSSIIIISLLGLIQHFIKDNLLANRILLSFGLGLSPILFVLHFLPFDRLFFLQEKSLFLFSSLTFLMGGLFFLDGPVLKAKDFENIPNLTKLSQKLDSLEIKMDNENLLKPEYDKYYHSLDEQFLKERVEMILQALGLRSVPAWTEMLFVELIKQAAAKEPLAKNSFVGKIKAEPGNKIVIFGEIQGAFPSLVRDLIKLNELGILDQELKISQGNYIVLLGDVVSRSPFQLETLTLILCLAMQNPETFIYLKGGHERDDYWLEFNLKSELQIRLADRVKDGDEKVPLQKLVNKFFSMLPEAVYVNIPGTEPLSFLRLAHNGPEASDIFKQENQNKLYKFLYQDSSTSKVSYKSLDGLEAAGGDVILSAVFKSEKKRENYQDMDGLRALMPEDGIAAWTVMSCPTPVYQKGLKFFNDAFVVTSFGKEPKDHKFTLYKQDVRQKKGFETREAQLVASEPLKAEDASAETEKSPEKVEQPADAEKAKSAEK